MVGTRGGHSGRTRTGKPRASTSSTTRLPEALRAELDEQEAENYQRDHGGRAGKRGGGVVGRKEARKDARSSKKAAKASFFSGGRPPQPTRALDPNDARTTGRERAPPASKPTSSASTPAECGAKRKPTKAPAAQPKPKRTALEKLAAEMEKPSKARKRRRMGDPEDDEIAWLEYKLRGEKKDGEDDGLDDLLDHLDHIVTDVGESESEPSEGGESEDEEGSEGESEGDEDQEDEEESEPGSDEDADADLGGEWGGISDEEESDDEDAGAPDSTEALADASTPAAPAQPSAPAKYVPPAMRRAAAAAAASSASASAAPQETPERAEDLARLEKAAKGLLNRLSEANIDSILTGLEALYRSHPRHDVTTTISRLVLSTLSTRANMLDSFTILYAGLVSALHRIIGIEFAAHFVQTLIQQFDSRPLSSTSEENEGGKESLNLLSLLAELYNLGVVSCLLVYDLVRALIGAEGERERGMAEVEVEGLMRILRSAGQQLRSDDPTALKDIVLAVQKQTESQDAARVSSRTRFMLETLTNLKNNRLKALPGGTGGEETRTRMKKYLSGLSKKRTVMSHEPLRVSLADLRSAESKGRWWIVGAGWGGNPLLDTAKDAAAASKAAKAEESELLRLARRQGMNTDIRRSIFVVLMSSEDYIDACERLLGMGLSEIQQREIMRVILHCCGNEKTYNPFYALVASHLLKTSHSSRITLQYCLWDFMREMGESSVGGAGLLKGGGAAAAGGGKGLEEGRMRNVARAAAWWVAKGGLSLTVFKPVNFPTLQPTSQRFFAYFFAYLLLSTQSASPTLVLKSRSKARQDRPAIEGVFMKAAPLPALTQGLLWFLSGTMRKGPGAEVLGGGEAETELVRWGVEVARETLKVGATVIEGI